MPYSSDTIRRMLNIHSSRFTLREQIVLAARHGLMGEPPMLPQEVSKRLGIKPEAVANIEQKANRKIAQGF